MPRLSSIAMSGFFTCAAVIFALPALSEDQAPRSYIASPDVYKVIAQNDKIKVILATWPPGKRDNWHSHPATGVYRLADCSARVYTPDGRFTDSESKAGSAVVQAPIPSHSLENRGTTECKVIIVEQE